MPEKPRLGFDGNGHNGAGAGVAAGDALRVIVGPVRDVEDPLRAAWDDVRSALESASIGATIRFGVEAGNASGLASSLAVIGVRHAVEKPDGHIQDWVTVTVWDAPDLTILIHDLKPADSVQQEALEKLRAWLPKPAPVPIVELPTNGTTPVVEGNGEVNHGEIELSAADLDQSAQALTPAAIYLDEVARYELLTPEQEIEYSKQVLDGLDAEERRASSLPAESVLLDEVIEAGHAAHRKLVESNLRLVISVARRYQGMGIALMDLIQEGNIGLYRAATRFDYSRGFRFSTYACWWIRQGITRAIADQSRTIRLPVHIHERMSGLARATRELEQELGRAPYTEEIADRMGLTVEQVEVVMHVARANISLDEPVFYEGEEVVRSNAVADPQARDPYTESERSWLTRAVEQAAEELTPRERQVLGCRFGLFGFPELPTLEAIGKKLGFTRQRIQQHEQTALRKLRNPKLRQVVGEYLA